MLVEQDPFPNMMPKANQGKRKWYILPQNKGLSSSIITHPHTHTHNNKKKEKKSV